MPWVILTTKKCKPTTTTTKMSKPEARCRITASVTHAHRHIPAAFGEFAVLGRCKSLDQDLFAHGHGCAHFRAEVSAALSPLPESL